MAQSQAATKPHAEAKKGEAKKNGAQDGRRFAVVDNTATPQPRPRRLTPAQFVSTEMAQLEKDSLRIVTRNVGEVAKQELVNLVNISSSLKARYMIALLDITAAHALASSAHIDEVRGWRERYEELDRGLENMKKAILDGTVKVKGLEGSE